MVGRQYQYAGHTAGIDDNRWTQKVTDWRPENDKKTKKAKRQHKTTEKKENFGAKQPKNGKNRTLD